MFLEQEKTEPKKRPLLSLPDVSQYQRQIDREIKQAQVKEETRKAQERIKNICVC